jgi:hypothetical protein
MKSYDIFVHFVGPNLLIGFTADITRWNTIIGFSGKEIFCGPETEIGIDVSNANLKFAYSAIIFNNYNNNQLTGATKNFIIAEFKYSQKKISNPQSLLLAVYNSFRAVVGVADQFYRLKTHLMNIVSGLAVLKLLKKILRKVLRFLQLRAAERNELIDQSAWQMADRFSEAENLVKENAMAKRQTNWPLIMFFGVVLGGPWLIWKILSSIENLKKDDSFWMEGKIDHFIAVSEHDFDSVNVDELSFRKGQRIIIAPKG